MDLPARGNQTGAGPWWPLVKRLVLCNPFYLCSAALLLYAINRLSIDPGFLSDETANLLFNFSALQVYELLLVVTAIVLAARRVWYDSALLVVLENGLLLVPFMLISQAAFIQKGLAWALSAVAALMVAGRFYAIRHYYPRFNLPGRALLVGLLVLGFNLALPHIFRPWVEHDAEDWRVPNEILWWMAMPVLAACANLLSRATRHSGLNPERSWLPLFNYGLWLIGTGVHVWSLGYICKIRFEFVFLAPAACVCAWTLFNRFSDFVANPSAETRSFALGFAFLTPLLAIEQPWLLVSVASVNTIGFIAVFLTNKSKMGTTARELALLSMVMIFAGLPREWMPSLTRPENVCGAMVVYCVMMALRSGDPRIGILGAIAVAFSTGWLARDWTWHAAAQATCAFLLCHSLRWPRDIDGAGFLRLVTGLIWTSDAIFWTRNGGWASWGSVAALATIVLAIWAIHRWRTGSVSLVGPISAVIVLFSGPANWFSTSAPAGIIALVASVALFGIGTVVAWNRHAWENEMPPEGTGGKELSLKG